ncbi:uncharacterized protein LOC111267626 isoform X1 [Varroa jacobsoni]|uniref:uncharacterized protein LOC111267626 isoform X1 n=2 Tax=Varroa jacobsoni TaxID=62625 RepID=UPI000BF9BC64|nr:uncharacterized protein LOC111267626 isoform X1 [Varroa jacobsoni]
MFRIRQTATQLFLGIDMDNRCTRHPFLYSSYSASSESCSSVAAGVTLPAHVSVLGQENASNKMLFLYGLPAGVETVAVRDAVVDVLKACDMRLIRHLETLDINSKYGTCIFYFERHSWAAATLSYFTSNGVLEKLQTLLGGFELNISFNSRYDGDVADPAARKLCELVLDNLPSTANSWDIFQRLMFQPNCDLVPLRVKITDNRKAIVTFTRRENLLYAVFRLSCTPLVIDGVRLELHWIQNSNDIVPDVTVV